MKEKGKELWNRYGAVLLYLFFGGCTTILNVCLYYCLRHLAGYSLNASNIAAWVGAVLFAYVTNRKWVFESKAKGALPVAKEIGRFFACRLATGIMDVGIMYFTVTLCGWNDVIMKLISNCIVIVVNYAASKLIIFRKTKNSAVGLYLLLTMVCAFSLFPGKIIAAGAGEEETKTLENAVEGTVMTVNTQTDIFKDTGKSEKAGRLNAGELIFVTGVKGDWLQFLYHGEDAYIESKFVTKPAENTALLEEMKTQEQEAGRDLELFLESQEQRKGRRIWGSIIGILILLIFLMGLWSLKSGDTKQGRRQEVKHRRKGSKGRKK